MILSSGFSKHLFAFVLLQLHFPVTSIRFTNNETCLLSLYFKYIMQHHNFYFIAKMEY